MKTKWKVVEDIDGAYVYPVSQDKNYDQNYDDMAFGRIRPVAKLNEHAPAEIVSQFCAFINGTSTRKSVNSAMSRAMRLQREHERQSNAAAVKDGSVIKPNRANGTRDNARRRKAE